MMRPGARALEGLAHVEVVGRVLKGVGSVGKPAIDVIGADPDRLMVRMVYRSVGRDRYTGRSVEGIEIGAERPLIQRGDPLSPPPHQDTPRLGERPEGQWDRLFRDLDDDIAVGLPHQPTRVARAVTFRRPTQEQAALSNRAG